MTIKARISDIRNDERRGAARRDVAIDAHMRELGAEGSEARVINISETGFMAEVDEVYDVGTRVWLILPGRERANALVRWVAGNRLGAEFSEPIDLDGLNV